MPKIKNARGLSKKQVMKATAAAVMPTSSSPVPAAKASTAAVKQTAAATRGNMNRMKSYRSGL